MAIIHYLAMTAAEIQRIPSLPPKIGWMSCHFSPVDRGLSNLPGSLPPGQLLILDDAIPMDGHDPERILAQLWEMVENHQCEAVLLDFQRSPNPHTVHLTQRIAEHMSCPVGVSEDYAGGLSCPVFLPPVPPDTLPESWLSPWGDREIWLDAAANGEVIRLTEKGAERAPLTEFSILEDGFAEQELCCHYRIALEKGMARFTLFRTREDISALCGKANDLGVTRAITLWQEMDAQLRR